MRRKEPEVEGTLSELKGMILPLLWQYLWANEQPCPREGVGIVRRLSKEVGRITSSTSSLFSTSMLFAQAPRILPCQTIVYCHENRVALQF